MGDKKWEKINMLRTLRPKIEVLVTKKKYSSVPNFIDHAIREKLERESNNHQKEAAENAA